MWQVRIKLIKLKRRKKKLYGVLPSGNFSRCLHVVLSKCKIAPSGHRRPSQVPLLPRLQHGPEKLYCFFFSRVFSSFLECKSDLKVYVRCRITSHERLILYPLSLTDQAFVHHNGGVSSGSVTCSTPSPNDRRPKPILRSSRWPPKDRRWFRRGGRGWRRRLSRLATGLLILRTVPGSGLSYVAAPYPLLTWYMLPLSSRSYLYAYFFFYLSVSCLLFYLVGLSHYIPSFLWRPINPEWNCLVKYNFNKRSTCCVSFYYYLLFLRLDVIVLFNYTFF